MKYTKIRKTEVHTQQRVALLNTPTISGCGENTHEMLYQIDLFFIKNGNILLMENESGQLSVPTSVTSWDYPPEELAEEYARTQLGIRIDQFDYPLGFQQILYEGELITSYALVPSMWYTRDDCKLAWYSPLRTMSAMTNHTKEVMRRYFHRAENEITFGRYCA